MKQNNGEPSGILPSSRSNADTIRFEVLKALKYAPTHGYNLYLLLSQKGLVAHPPELYKILRSLKDRGLIQEDPRESVQGPQKKVLSLTPTGMDEYYARVTESLQIFMDLMAEAQFSVLHDLLVTFLAENGVVYQDLEGQVIFFDIGHMPPPMQREFLLKFALPLQEKNILYLRTKDSTVWELYPYLEKILTNVTILDENLNVKSDAIDMIFCFGGNNAQKFEKRLGEFVQSLKSDGAIILTKFGSQEAPPPPRMFASIFQDFIKTFPEKFQKQFMGPFARNKTF